MCYERVWLLTWTTYGSWLPGDRRGFGGTLRNEEGKKYFQNEPSTEYFADLPGLEFYAQSQLKSRPVFLTIAQATVLKVQFEETARHRQWTILAGAIMKNHVHLVVGVPGDPDPEVLLRDFKAYGSRSLNRDCPRERWWTKSGSTRKLPDDVAVEAGVGYVQKQFGALVIWLHGEEPAS